MSAAETVLAVIGSVGTVLTPVAGLGWWIYKRAWASGYRAAERDAIMAEDKARVESLERQLAETREQLAAIQRSQLGSGHP
jgi:hypothetical protein